MANVKTGTRSKAGDKAAQDAQVEAATQTGKELVEDNGQQFLVERVGTITIKERLK